MVKLLLLIFMTSNAFAINGFITVLEAPIFEAPDEKSKVIQYYRKGQDIFIHSQETAEEPYRNLKFKYKDVIRPRVFKDPLLETPYQPEKESKFYKTIARSGRDAYVLKEHVLIEYKDAREIGQDAIDFDHTDYRIEEPIPSNYPFLYDNQYRGHLTIGLGRSNFDPYPYRQRLLDQSINLMTDVSFIWTRSQEINPQKRFYFGYLAGFIYSRQAFIMREQEANQTNLRFYIGPHADYDVYRDKKQRFNLSISTQLYLFDSMDISITNDNLDRTDTRNYQSRFGISPQLGAKYVWKKGIGNLDFGIGTFLRINLPRDYRAVDSGETNGIWRQKGTEDEYYQSVTSEMTYSITLNNSY